MSQFPPLQVCHIISLWPVTSGFRCPKVSVSHPVGVENLCFGLINSSGGHSLLSVFLIIIIKLILILNFFTLIKKKYIFTPKMGKYFFSTVVKWE
jgi:hypothetical protein